LGFIKIPEQDEVIGTLHPDQRCKGPYCRSWSCRKVLLWGSQRCQQPSLLGQKQCPGGEAVLPLVRVLGSAEGRAGWWLCPHNSNLCFTVTLFESRKVGGPAYLKHTL